MAVVVVVVIDGVAAFVAVPIVVVEVVSNVAAPLQSSL